MGWPSGLEFTPPKVGALDIRLRLFERAQGFPRGSKGKNWAPLIFQLREEPKAATI